MRCQGESADAIHLNDPPRRAGLTPVRPLSWAGMTTDAPVLVSARVQLTLGRCRGIDEFDELFAMTAGIHACAGLRQ